MGIRYARGRRAWGHCERCGLRYKLHQLKSDGYSTRLLVCSQCYDPEHPQERLPDVVDPVVLRDPTGDLDKAAANEPLPEMTLAWSVASVTEIDGTATISYTNAVPPVELLVQWVGDNNGLDFIFSGSTFTLLAGTAEPGEVTATIRATLTDVLGKTKTADLAIAVTITAITVFNLAATGSSASYDHMYYSSGPTGIEPWNGSFHELTSPDFEEIYPGWSGPGHFLPETDSYPVAYYANQFIVSSFSMELTVKMRGVVPDGWSASDALSANVAITGTAPSGDTCVVTVTLSCPEIGVEYTGRIDVTADVGGTPHTATIHFGFSQAGF